MQRAPEAAEIAIGRLPMVSAEERAALMRRGQGERVALPENATLPMLLAQQAERSPNATALVCGEERLTYAELHARADRLARRLVGLGVGPETLVGICLPRTIVLIVAILAVHKAGGAYLLLDPSYRIELTGDSMRKLKAAARPESETTPPANEVPTSVSAPASKPAKAHRK